MPSRLSPAERVARLRKAHGSHDKLAAAVAAKSRELGQERRPTRQLIIGWERGAGISEAYARVLAELAGVSPSAFRPRSAPEEYRTMREEMQQLRAEVERLRSQVTVEASALEVEIADAETLARHLQGLEGEIARVRARLRRLEGDG